MLAVHGTTGTLIGTTADVSLTSLGYSGEHFDSKVQQQYLRARFYDPANGRFNRLDPFVGNMQDPQSLHKYAYVHGDPISNIDPSGNVGILGHLVRRLASSGKTRVALEGGVYAIAKALIGTQATYVLGNAYIKENQRDPSNVAINKAIARLKDSNLPIDEQADGWLEQMQLWRDKPDIVDHTSGSQQFYEIKPVSMVTAGLSQVVHYDTQLQLRYPGINYSRGTWQPRKKVYRIEFAYGVPVPLTISASNYDPGLVVYQSNGNEDALLVAAIAAEVAIEIAASGALRAAAGGAVASGARVQQGWANAFLVAMVVGF